MKTLSLRFLLPFGLAAVLFSALVLYRAYTMSQRHAHELLSQQAALALEFNLAIRDYAAEQIRPVMERLVDKDEFLPETMSTSFISRRIFEMVRKKFPDCVIHFASDNPRNPINKASPDELRMIAFFRQHPQAERRTEEMRIEGRRYLAHFTPKWMKPECLRCHGDPKDAPAALIKRYGATASFHRKVGDVVALDTVAVPLDAMNALLAAEMRWQSLILAAGLALLFGAIAVLFRVVVTRRLAAMAGHFHAIADHPEGARLTPLAVGEKDEIGLVGTAFNKLVEHLRQAQARLEERVTQRTAELASANQELRGEIAERQQAEKALQETEAQARASARLLEGLFDAIPDVIGVQDGQRRVIRYNAAGYRFLGLSPEQVRGKLCYELIGRVKPCDVCATAESLRTKQPAQIEKQVPELGIWLECRSYPVLDERGEVVYVLEHLRDITERKRGEQTLREHRDMLSSILRAAPTGIGVVCNRILTEVNDRICEMTGYSREELLNQSSRLLYPSDAEYEFVGREKYDQIKAHGTGTVETRWQRKNGTILEVLLSSTPIHPEDWSAGVTFTALDITKRKRAEDALRESEERFASFMRQLPGFAFVKDHDRRILYVNEIFETAFGLALPEWRGKTNDEIWPGEVGEKIRRDDEAVLAAGEPRALIEDVPTHGELRTYRTIKFPIPRPDGRPWLGGISVDITELRRAEQRLQAVLDEKTVLLREVHHRVKNNLQAMIALMRMRERQITDPAMRQLLAQLQEQARTMSLVHEQLYQSENLAQVKMLTYLRALSMHVVRAFGRDRDVDLRFEVDDLLLDVADASPCGLIVNELLTNALKHAFPPGFVSRPVLEVGLRCDGGRFVLIVADNGQGLPAGLDWEHAPSMGLHLVHLWATHQMGGTIQVDTAQGTRYTIAFEPAAAHR